MISFGVPLGAQIACQGEMCRPGTPASSTVGTSGAVAVRLFAMAANTLMRPARNCGSAVTGSSDRHIDLAADQIRASPARCRDRARTGICVPVMF